MRTGQDRVRHRREAAWAYGRELSGSLVSQHQAEYGLAEPPPPARVIDELLRDILKVELRYQPLPVDRFAEAKSVNDKITVVVNSMTQAIQGVKDEEGVQNVAKWHECIHVTRDLDYLREELPPMLPGFEGPSTVICRRGLRRATTSAEIEREFWAEEAGRAAAVSIPALARSAAFRELLQNPGLTRQGWPLLYQAASDIAVNISALVKQLRLEGLIMLVPEGGRD